MSRIPANSRIHPGFEILKKWLVMIILLSPSKTQTESPLLKKLESTKPVENEKANFLMAALKMLSVDDLSKMMGLSNLLLKKTHENIKKFSYANKNNITQAIHLFQGDAFQKLDSASLSENNLLFAQNHIIILSALYGYLRPLDAVQTYRLDMNDPIKINNNKNLYTYWKETITEGLNNLLLTQKNKIILNLASSEYFKKIDLKKLSAKVIHVDFMVLKDKKYKTVGIYAKRGRGLLTRYIIDKQIDSPEKIVGFNEDGFQYEKSLSTPEKYVFVLKTN